ncbi:MAG: hypothetical protein U1E28_03835 [Beijerinckiaceae bacterium]
MAFLRREIARIEGRPDFGRRVSGPGGGNDGSALAGLLSAERLSAGLHEIVPASARDVFVALGFALRLCGLCARARASAGIVIAIEDFVAAETGAPYGPGLVEAGIDPERLAIVRTQNPRETLRAMEDALRCPDVAAVLAESAIDARLYSLDVSRRLTLAARAGGAAGFLAPVALAGAGKRMSSMAETRVEVARRTSAIEKFGEARLGLPGAPVAALRLMKARSVHGLDSECVHEVAYDAFSVGPPPLSRDRPDPAFAKARALSA